MAEAFLAAYLIVSAIVTVALAVLMWRQLYEAARKGDKDLDYEMLQQPHGRAAALVIVSMLAFIAGTAWLSVILAVVVCRIAMHVLHP